MAVALLVAAPVAKGQASGRPPKETKARGAPLTPSPDSLEEEGQAFVLQPLEPQVEPPDEDPFGFSVYRGQRPEPMGTQTLINGARMDIAFLLVSEPMDVVTRAYLASLEQEGITPLMGSVPQDPGLRYLSFRPPGSCNLKTLTLLPHGTGTLILASVGNPEELLAGKPELPGGVPLPPNAERPSALQQLEPGAVSQSAFFLVRGATVEQVRAFYQRELPPRGFAPAGSGGATDQFERSDALLSLSVTRHPEAHTVAVSLLWMEQEAP
jgi:hypothetical protein